MSKLDMLQTDFASAHDFMQSTDGNISGTLIRRRIEVETLKGADIAIDLGAEPGSNRRHVALTDHDANGFELQEVDSDLMDAALCRDNVHGLADLSAGRGNQFAPYMESFQEEIQSSNLPDQVRAQISEYVEMHPDAARQDANAVAEVREVSGVCTPEPGR